jgi:hypothetical protein
MRVIGLGLVLAAPLAAAAGPLSDQLMATGLFKDAVTGPLLAYDETRSVEDAGPTEARVALVRVDTAEGPKLQLTQGEGAAAEEIAVFSTGSANPVLLYFLEATVRDMAAATGGNPFYVRNRIREALVASDLGAGEPREVVLQPFAADPNRGRMGDYADVSLRFRFEAEHPDRLLELSADTAGNEGGYHHRMTLAGED